jgi:CxxC motif-containing protein (DUF1111 family)
MAPPPGGRLFGVALVALGLGLLAAATAPMLAGAQSAETFQAHDPGVRDGTPGAGGPIAGLSANQTRFFQTGLARFSEVDAVADGLGPRFNMDSCAGCHAQPAVGGSSPAVNPQIAVASKAGAKNTVPSFITANGPVREARFVKNADGSNDGGVHDLFTIVGRSDTPNTCNPAALPQPDFAAQLRANNVIFRIPTPTFGAGLISAITDEAILANQAADGSLKSSFGISGDVNREGNAGTISRFGWKAQNKSLTIFAGEAYLVEQGVSNEVFTQERGEPGEQAAAQPCFTNATPEDFTDFDTANTAETSGDAASFAMFSTLLAAPAPVRFSSSAQNGAGLFNQVGCNLCHTPQLTTGRSQIGSLSNQTANLFSDLLVHDMGTGLQDGVSQGGANGREFRTAPLWGVGQRIFFLHYGRTKDLLAAINAHSSSGSEANGVISRFNSLSQFGQQDILNFLRSL